MKTATMRFVSAAVLLLTVNGCVVPIISGFRDMGVTADSRQELLRNDLRAFQAAMLRHNMQTVLGYVAAETPDLKERLREEIRSASRKEKVVEGNVEYIDYNDDSTEATVDVRVRYFRVPYYVVKNRTETQKWRFAATSGWKITSRELEEVGDDA